MLLADKAPPLPTRYADVGCETTSEVAIIEDDCHGEKGGDNSHKTNTGAETELLGRFVVKMSPLFTCCSLSFLSCSAFTWISRVLLPCAEKVFLKYAHESGALRVSGVGGS